MLYHPKLNHLLSPPPSEDNTMKFLPLLFLIVIYGAALVYSAMSKKREHLHDPTRIVTVSLDPPFKPMREEGQAQHDERLNAYRARLIQHRSTLDHDTLEAFDREHDQRGVKGAEWQRQFSKNVSPRLAARFEDDTTLAVGGTD